MKTKHIISVGHSAWSMAHSVSYILCTTLRTLRPAHCAMKFLFILFLYVLPYSNFVFAQKKADGALGTWFNEEKDCKLRIYKCGKSGEKYCGKIIWLDEPNEEDGTPKADDENSDPKLQKRPLMGLVIMKRFVYDEDNVWEDGKIYDPENGKEYSCKMTLISKDRLDIRGYIGFSFIGRTAEWTRAE